MTGHNVESRQAVPHIGDDGRDSFIRFSLLDGIKRQSVRQETIIDFVKEFSWIFNLPPSRRDTGFQLSIVSKKAKQEYHFSPKSITWMKLRALDLNKKWDEIKAIPQLLIFTTRR